MEFLPSAETAFLYLHTEFRVHFFAVKLKLSFFYTAPVFVFNNFISKHTEELIQPPAI